MLVIFVVFFLPKIVKSLKNNKKNENVESENGDDSVSDGGIDPVKELKAKELIQKYSRENAAFKLTKRILLSLFECAPIIYISLLPSGAIFSESFDALEYLSCCCILGIPWMLYSASGAANLYFDAIITSRWLTKNYIDYYTFLKNGVITEDSICAELVNGILLKEQPNIRGIYYLKSVIFVAILVLFSVLFRKNIYPIIAEYGPDIGKVFSCFKTSGGILCCAVFIIGLISQLYFRYYFLKKRVEIFVAYAQN